MDRCVKKVKKNAKVVSGWCSRYEGGCLFQGLEGIDNKFPPSSPNTNGDFKELQEGERMF